MINRRQRGIFDAILLIFYNYNLKEISNFFYFITMLDLRFARLTLIR